MATPVLHSHIDPFWDDEYKSLSYKLETFNNRDDLVEWKRQGYVHPDSHYTGFLCDMRSPQPSWNDKIIHWAEDQFGFKDIGTSYYRMGTGVILPCHKDTYAKYCELFDLTVNDCERIVVFLEDWQSGHYFEIDGCGKVNWKRGDYVYWKGDTEHMAANLGLTKRYTLQITGHK